MRKLFAAVAYLGSTAGPHHGDRPGPLPTLDYADAFGDGTPSTYDYGTWTSPVAYIYYPRGRHLPHHVDGLTRNW